MKSYFLYGLLAWYLTICGYGFAAESDITLKDNTTNSGFSIKEETASSTIARFRGDGNVGIATTSPTEKLEVNGNIKISGTGNGIKFPDGTNQTTAATVGGGSGDGHSLDAADGDPTDAIFVDDSGNVGIGTTVPGQKLSVTGTVESTSGGFKFPDGTTQTTSSNSGGSSIVSKSNSDGTATHISGDQTIHSFTLSGGELGTDGGIKIVVPLKEFNSSTGTNPTFALKYAGVTVASFTISMAGQGSLNTAGYLEAVLFANGATNSQFGFITLATTASSMQTNGSAAMGGSGDGTSSVDSTSNQTVSITINYGSGSGSSSNELTSAGYYAVKL